MNPVVERAFEVAARDLRNCYDSFGIFAGRGHFQQYWARDSFFSSLGATKLRDFGIVKKQLEFFMKFQRTGGNIPNQVTQQLKPHYRLIGSRVVDATALFVVAFADYVRETKDTSFAKKHFFNAKRAVEWLQRKDKDRDYLIEEGFFANWADSVLKFGKVLYTNCCYFRALTEFAWLCRQLNKADLARYFEDLADKVRNAINYKFWVGEYYADWIDFKVQRYFASDGNVLSIVWGVADDEQSKMIENKIKQFQLNKMPLKTNYPSYPFWRIPFVLFPFQAYHYHNGFSWPWLGCMNAIALRKIGWKDTAKDDLKKIAKAIVENGTVHEVFWEGKPVASLLVESEKPFAWNAAMFIKAVKEIGK